MRSLVLIITMFMSCKSFVYPSARMRQLDRVNYDTLYKMSDFSRASRRIVSSIASEPGNNNGGSELAINNPNSIARKQDLQALKRQVRGGKTD